MMMEDTPQNGSAKNEEAEQNEMPEAAQAPATPQEKPAPQSDTQTLGAGQNTNALQKPRSENYDLDYVIDGGSDFAYLKVQLPAGKTVAAEASAMMSMDTNIKMKTKIKGGLKRLITKESLFINRFTAEGSSGEVVFANGLPGDICHYHLDGVKRKSIFLQSSSFLASGEDVQQNVKWQGMIKGFFSGAGLFLIKCEGAGDVFFSAYGSIIEIDVKGEYVVDNSHIVAFEDGLDYKITKVGGMKSFFLSGEALVTKFSGEGKIWIQTRKFPAFASWIYPFRPAPRRSD